MGRLIDEDELIKGRVENDPVVIAAKCAPTAYNLDRVVAQLENLKTINVDIGFGTLANTLRKEVVLDIVKGGGVDA